jgi:DNA-directed RNA polymerase specialized sigma24 family protein
MADTVIASGEPDRADGVHLHYQALVRLAALLTGDAALAEEIAGDSLAAILPASPRLYPGERVLFRLHREVVLRSRRATRIGPQPRWRPAHPLASDRGSVWSGSPIMQGLRSLSACQREALVLRHYLDLSEKQAAAVMGARQRAVHRSLAIARDALQGMVAESTDAGDAAPDWPAVPPVT